jgi:hypothetical protein
MESLLNNPGLANLQDSEMAESVASALAQESESLLNHEELKKANEELAGHLSVYDQPEITKPTDHPVYEGGIPPYEVQAQIVFDNYMNSANRFMSGKEKRRLYRECLRNAKKGRYNYMFDPAKMQKRQERARQNFDKMNKPQ